MEVIRNFLKGDLVVWGLVLLLALVSFLPIYSASSTLAWRYSGGNTLSWLFKHGFHLITGLIIMWGVSLLNFRFLGKLTLLITPLSVALLAYTLTQGSEIGGANASRWVRVPVAGISFQSSAFASLWLLIYLARWLSIKRDLSNFKSLTTPLLYILIICGLILPADFSTAAILFTMSMAILLAGKVPWKHIFKIVGSGILLLSIFILSVMAFPGISNRVSTWISRVTTYVGQGDSDGNYQRDLAQMAIAEGGLFGQGAGKSVQKNFLPQSESDFVFAIIAEEYGMIGSILLAVFYAVLFLRMVRISVRAHTKFGTLLALSATMGMLIQTLVNMGVATALLPVTGQTLPLMSSGGSSIWMTCMAFGVALSVSHSDVDKVTGVTEQEAEEAGIDTDIAYEPELNA